MNLNLISSWQYTLQRITIKRLCGMKNNFGFLYLLFLKVNVCFKKTWVRIRIFFKTFDLITIIIEKNINSDVCLEF